MDMAWFRDLSITLLGLVTSGVLIFGAALGYRLYREAKIALETIQLTTKTARETVTAASEAITPILPILLLIQGIRGGFKGIGKLFTKQNNEGGDSNG